MWCVKFEHVLFLLNLFINFIYPTCIFCIPICPGNKSTNGGEAGLRVVEGAKVSPRLCYALFISCFPATRTVAEYTAIISLNISFGWLLNVCFGLDRTTTFLLFEFILVLWYYNSVALWILLILNCEKVLSKKLENYLVSQISASWKFPIGVHIYQLTENLFTCLYARKLLG